QPTVFFRREALFAGGLLDETLHWGLDWELWIRLAKRHPLSYTDRVLAASRIYGDTKTATGGWRRLRELAAILSRHGVPWHSPAMISHAIITLVRKRCDNAELITPAVMTNSVPGPFRRPAAPMLAMAERQLRRWLQNVQGVWSDGMVGRAGSLWLPCDGRSGYLKVRGKNLGIAGQMITVQVDGRTATTGRLDSEARFTLELEASAGSIPVKVRLRCACTLRVAPLDPRLGPRQAGFLLEQVELVTP
ncbi:MAG: hypothetical protein LUO80_08105, partial [Methylococcaceae bacterium]|nr:hypothetical protein [Methylococcaceae bacterium]